MKPDCTIEKAKDCPFVASCFIKTLKALKTLKHIVNKTLTELEQEVHDA